MLVTGLERVTEDGQSVCYGLEGLAELEVFSRTLPDVDRAVDDCNDRADAADHLEARHLRRQSIVGKRGSRGRVWELSRRWAEESLQHSVALPAG